MKAFQAGATVQHVWSNKAAAGSAAVIAIDTSVDDKVIRKLDRPSFCLVSILLAKVR